MLHTKKILIFQKRGGSMLLLRWASQRPSCSGVVSRLTNSVRHYYKPKHKDAFFDVEGVVTKDTLLFRYEDVSKVRMRE
jgi:hypothetical protein